MKISRKDNDALNTLITINIERNDFEKKVNNVLTDYRKKANIPGFRKGHVPMGMIKKQYETAVTADEVNKLLQQNLDQYLKDEKINILGNPLPVMHEDLDWKAPELSFSFELGLSPEFEVKLTEKNKVIHYQITATDEMINDQVKHYRKQFGKLVAQKNVKDDFEITAAIRNEAAEIETSHTFDLGQIKGKSNKLAFGKATVGDEIKLKCKGLFKDESTATRILSVSTDKLKDIEGEISFEIKEINERILAEMNQEFFDKIFGPDVVKSEEEMKAKITEGIEKQFEQQSDQKLLNDITEYLVAKTKFDLPAEFLKKWMQNSGEQPLTAEAAGEEYERSEKGIRYQLIEGKIIAGHDLQIKFEELKEFAKEMILMQMAQYGQAGLPDEELEGIVARVMSNQDEARKLSEQLMSKKLLEFYKSNLSLKKKKLSFDAFVKEAYGQG
ncbi:MAG: trigger factor [Flavobacteriaceae bacterium]|nr:trigger factor [Flavobacteriaceae bacterium]